MEKDSFESQLNQLINNADQHQHAKSDGREKVWATINNTKRKNKVAYYVAAAVFFVCLASILLFTKKEKASEVITKNELRTKIDTVHLQGSNVQLIRKSKTKTIAGSKIKISLQGTNNVAIDQSVQFEYPTGKTSQTAIDYSKDTKLAMINALPKVELVIPENKTPQPEFTVQFKRGKPIETAEELQAKEAMALKKLKFRRDTSAFTSSNVKPTNSLKIKF
jgi:hypothetical protein